MTTPSSELFRIDPLTGCKNYLGFLEALANASLATISDNPTQPTLPEIVEKIPWIGSSQNSSVLFLDLCDLKTLNDSRGRAYGDSAIRWMGILLGEESNCPVFRLGGGDYALLLTTGTHTDHNHILGHILERVERESKSLGMAQPAVHIALIQYQDSPTTIDSILMQMGEAMIRVKYNHDTNYMIFSPGDFNITVQPSTRGESVKALETFYSMRWISRKNVYHVMEMGRMLDQIQKDAYTDAISGLPNMRAAFVELEKEISSKQPFSVLLMDGDELTRYNNISYAAGDEMIRRISAILTESLRPGDFVARWRSGDEFIAVLPNTTSDGAMIVGERFCSAIREASKNWRFPTSITVGIAMFPKHGNTVNTLVDMAEGAMKKGKDTGKDKVILAE